MMTCQATLLLGRPRDAPVEAKLGPLPSARQLAAAVRPGHGVEHRHASFYDVCWPAANALACRVCAGCCATIAGAYLLVCACACAVRATGQSDTAGAAGAVG